MIELRKITDDNFDECIKLEPIIINEKFAIKNVTWLTSRSVGLYLYPIPNVQLRKSLRYNRYSEV